ncbi:MAG: helix-turn-helix domain-containing protein [Bacillota bacterium]
MSGTGASLFVHSETRQLDILLQGIAASLGMQYCSVSLLEEPEATWGRSLKGVWVIGVREVRDDHVVLAKRLSRDFSFPVILVADALPRDTASELLRNGAIACFRTSEAFHELPCVIENLVRCLSRDDEALSVASDVILVLPSLVLTNGKSELRLPPILGRLLTCLARNAGYPVPHSVLIQTAWGKSDGATVKTLHQHIYNLRTALADFGIDHLIRAIRGSGYTLAKSGTQLIAGSPSDRGIR